VVRVTEVPEAAVQPDPVPAWVYRLDVRPPARHGGWRRAVRILHPLRRPRIRRRRAA